jgi:hypothetical protein
MSDFRIASPRVGFQRVADTSTTQNHALGEIVTAIDNATTAYGTGEFIYLRGVASTDVGSVVVYNPDDFSTALASANAIGPIATAMSANVASQYGWYQIGGKGVAKVLASFADNGDCYLTSTAGSIDDADVRRCRRGGRLHQRHEGRICDRHARRWPRRSGDVAAVCP